MSHGKLNTLDIFSRKEENEKLEKDLLDRVAKLNDSMKDLNLSSKDVVVTSLRNQYNFRLKSGDNIRTNMLDLFITNTEQSLELADAVGVNVEEAKFSFVYDLLSSKNGAELTSEEMSVLESMDLVKYLN